MRVGRPAYAVEVEAGREYRWCACGRSQDQPFCDGSHRGTGLGPVSYTADRNRIVWFCGCKRTQEQPWCDGSHRHPAVDAKSGSV